MFLTPAELKELTDLEQHAAQIRWLTDRGWKFEIGASGRPKVLRAEAERHMLSGHAGGGRRPRELNLRPAA